MPSLPRIKRSQRQRPAEGTVQARTRLAELEAAGLTWVHLDSPQPEEAAQLARRFGWHPLDLEDVLSKRQRPKVDDYPEYLFVVLHFPVFDKTIQRLNAAELDVFLGPDFLITLSNVELLPVTRLFGRCWDDEALRDELFTKGSGRLLYEVLDDLFDYCFPILDKIGHKLDSIEDEMFEGHAEDVVRDISNVKQEIISYRKIIKPERATLRLLERHTERFLPEALELYFDDIVDAAERIWDLLDNYKEVVEALEGTNESVIQHRQNDVLRLLTVFSVIILPLTLISGIFGMNVDFPGFGTGRGLLGDRRRDDRRRDRDGRVLPPQALAVSGGGGGTRPPPPPRLLNGERADLDRDQPHLPDDDRSSHDRGALEGDVERRVRARHRVGAVQRHPAGARLVVRMQRRQIGDRLRERVRADHVAVEPRVARIGVRAPQRRHDHVAPCGKVRERRDWQTRRRQRRVVGLGDERVTRPGRSSRPRRSCRSGRSGRSGRPCRPSCACRPCRPSCAGRSGRALRPRRPGRPAGPAGPCGPLWFQSSGDSPDLQCWLDASITRTSPSDRE